MGSKSGGASQANKTPMVTTDHNGKIINIKPPKVDSSYLSETVIKIVPIHENKNSHKALDNYSI